MSQVALRWKSTRYGRDEGAIEVVSQPVAKYLIASGEADRHDGPVPSPAPVPTQKPRRKGR